MGRRNWFAEVKCYECDEVFIVPGGGGGLALFDHLGDVHRLPLEELVALMQDCYRFPGKHVALWTEDNGELPGELGVEFIQDHLLTVDREGNPL